MKNSNSKSKSSEPEDRFSELHDSLIFHIFWFLPIVDFVRTSVLSKRWKNLWTTTPYLSFDDYTISSRTDRIRDFINRVLILWRGTKILKFKIDFRYLPDRNLRLDYDVWLRFAMENEVEELYIHLLYAEKKIREGYLSHLEAYWVIECIYRCPLLKVLSVKGCNFDGKMNGYACDVMLNRLKSLTIHGYFSDDCLNRVLAGSPQLEVLVLSLMDVGENMSVRSSSLKKLCIDLYLGYNDDYLSSHTQLTICTQNLETLEILGVPYGKCLLMNVSSLTRVTLGFKGYDSFTENGFLGETLMQILPTIKYVENVTLSDWSIKLRKQSNSPPNQELGAMKKKLKLSPLLNVKFLKLHGSFEKHQQIVGLLEIFPKLSRLVIQHEKVTNKQFYANQDVRESPVILTNPVKSFLLQLRTVEVTWAEGGNSIFPFIEMLLKYAKKLEKMVFRAPHTTPSNYLVLASQKLLRMPRSSPNAQLILC